jgi:exonuclease III
MDVYTLSEVPAYWIGEGKGADYFRGFTVEPQDDYVEYSEPRHTTDYIFTEDLRQFVVDNSGGGGGSGSGDTSGLLATTYNLLDESKIDWDFTGSYIFLNAGYYIPVEPNETYVCNLYKSTFRFYNSSYTEIYRETPVKPFTGVTAPAEALWLRVSWGISASGLSQVRPIMVYKTDSVESSQDDVKSYISHFEIQPDLVNGDIFTHAAPESLNAEILNMARQVSVRAFNKTRNAIRVGTFNIYLPRGRNHWELLKKECQDFSLDILAMQEISNVAERRVQRYLSNNNWQFLYGSRSEFDGVYPQQGIVSAYEIVSTELYTMSTNRTYVKCVINLPKYKKHPHQFTLSIYSFHGNLTASNRVTEVNEMLATIANDTSDFIIVCGDTNAFVSEADAMGKRPSWEAWITGGFTPIHYGEFSTIAEPTNVETGIDQIFMGHNVSCANWDIVPSYDYTLIDSNGDEIPISDHCMIYADLVFDYEAVLASL